jgi:hypothetical protein
MPIGNGSDQWFLEVNGKKFGPYTIAQIEALVRHDEIVGEDRVTAQHLNGRWMSVDEFVHQSGIGRSSSSSGSQKGSAGNATVPPRPDERTLTSIIAPSHRKHEARQPNSSAILNLFEILQAARERKAQTPSAVGQNLIEMPRPVRSSSTRAPIWIAASVAAVAATIYWKTSVPTTPVAADSDHEMSDVKIVKGNNPRRTVATTPQPPPATTAPNRVASISISTPLKAKPATSSLDLAAAQKKLRAMTHSSPSISERDRERERELEREKEREREREAERERERERERENDYARSGSSRDQGRQEYERERERELERDRDRLPAAASAAGPAAAAPLPVAGSDGPPVTGGTPVEFTRDQARDSGRDYNRDLGRDPAQEPDAAARAAYPQNP